MSASPCALTQTAILLLFSCEVQCFGVINHHFSTDGRKVTFPKVNPTRVCHAHKLRCFLHCAQDAGCRHVGVSAAGEVVLFDDPITPSPDDSVTVGYLYSPRVSGLTTKERVSTKNDASAISPISTSQQSRNTKETLRSSNSNSIQKLPASSSTATSHSRMTSTATDDGKPDTRPRPTTTAQLYDDGLYTMESGPDNHVIIEEQEQATDMRLFSMLVNAIVSNIPPYEDVLYTIESGTNNQGIDIMSIHRDSCEAFIRGIYTIVTQTGTEKDSGTDCYVNLDIYGQPGLREQLYLDKKGEDEMAIGANDTFKFTRLTDLGNITKMILRIGEFGIGPGWLVIGVEVRRTRSYERHTITETFYTYINKWFQRLDGVNFFNRKEEKYEMPYKLVSTVTTDQ